MFIEKFILPSAWEEKDYLISGKNTIGMPTRYDGNVPFGIFPKRQIEKINFGEITLLAGSSNSEKQLLMRIICAKLGFKLLPEGVSDRCLSDYLDMCIIMTPNNSHKKIPFELITKEQSLDFIKKQYAEIGIRLPKSLPEFYETRITPKKLYFIEEPENSMSLQECKELASLLDDCAKYSGNQFVITTNSPVLLGIKNAVIYNFDQRVIMDETWYYSKLAARHVKFYKELVRAHRKGKLKKEKLK